MRLHGEQVLMRIYLQSADRSPSTPTYERIVRAARHGGLAGATVLKGILGYGSRGMARRSLLSLTERVPVIVEIVDSGVKVVAFLEELAGTVLCGGLVTLERAHVITYRPGREAAWRLAAGIPPLSTLPQIKVSDLMTQNENGILLRVFIGESDRCGNQFLYEAIVHKARELGLAGATVLRGTEGFGAHSVVHKASLLEMSTDLPIVVEIVDVEERIQALLPYLESMVQEGMVTMEQVRILYYRHGATKGTPA